MVSWASVSNTRPGVLTTHLDVSNTAEGVLDTLTGVLDTLRVEDGRGERRARRLGGRVSCLTLIRVLGTHPGVSNTLMGMSNIDPGVSNTLQGRRWTGSTRHMQTRGARSFV